MMVLRRLSAYRALRPQARRTREDIDEWRDRKIRKLVQHAYRKVPYYRRLLDTNGIRPADIRGALDLERFPISQRRDIQDAPLEQRLARGVDPSTLIERKTTGSSGQCLTVMRTWREEQILNLFRWRALRAYGLERSDIIAVPRIPIPKHRRDHQLPRKIADKLHFYRKQLVDLTTFGDVAAEIIATRAQVIMGWPTILVDLAPKWAEMPGAYSPRFVITGGEVLTGFAREVIERAFDTRVYDMMGAHEFSLVAWECPETGEYHLSDETVYAEVVDANGRAVDPGESGELVATALHSNAMPFIRYKLGDLVTRGAAVCTCGSPFSTMAHIRGRTGDYLQLAGGRRVHPQDIARMSFIVARWIRELQVVQDGPGRLELHVVPQRPPLEVELEAVSREVRRILPAEVQFEIVLMPMIRKEYQRKFQVHREKAAL